MISWQGTRGDKLKREMEQAGFIKNGKMIQSQEALDFQAKYLAREMMEDPSYARTRRDFLGTDTPSYEKGMAALDQNFIAWDWRGKKIDAPIHYKRQRGHYANISNQTKDLRDYQQEAKEQQKTQEQQQKTRDELVEQYLTPYLVSLDKELSQQIAKINQSIATDQEKTYMINRARWTNIGKKESYKADFELKYQSHLLTPEQIVDLEHIKELGETVANTKFDENQLVTIRRHFEQVREDKKAIIALDRQERELEINRHTMPKADILKQEKQIDISRKKLSREYTDEQLYALEQW